MRRLVFFSICCFLFNVNASTQQDDKEDAFYIKGIYDHTLANGECYDWLGELTTQIGARLAGSPNAAAAVEYTRQKMEEIGMERVWLQECIVPHWIRGGEEVVRIVNSGIVGTRDLRALSLGNSTGTGEGGVTGEVIEVHSLDDVEELGTASIEGKIVFYNRPMDPTETNTFRAYGGAVDQRGWGPEQASRYGAVAAIVRSMTTKLDDVPHTGGTLFREETKQIPALAISTNDAELLSDLLEKESVTLYIENHSKMLPDKVSHNVIGEIRGTEFPDEIILVGGHLDSWDVGSGAHDDGAGCVHALQVVKTLKDLGYTPKRTIRCVMFMNEENGLAGGRKYAEVSDQNGEYHLAAIESDAGGFTPRGFTCDAMTEVFNQKFPEITKWLPLLEPYGLFLQKGGSGADINPLKGQGGLLFGFRPDPQRYFDFHHTAEDVFDAVNKRELELGAASITALVYLIDKYGLK